MATFKLRGIAVLDDGIVWYSDDELDRSVWLRMRRATDERFEIGEVYLNPDDGPILSKHLRAIPVGRIEAWCNRSEGSTQLVESFSAQPVSLEFAAQHEQYSGARITRAAKQKKQTAPMLKLTPDSFGGRGYTDDFYQSVAAAYEYLVASDESPAARLSEENAVPATTAHRWIREARKRGFLNAGRVGRKG